MVIPFNKPFIIGRELEYIKDAVERGKISGNGFYTKTCTDFFQKRYGFKKCLLTTSCTDALEMAAILCDIEPGDEVIIPSFTFVSTANAFVLRGAKIVFADCRPDIPVIDVNHIEELITSRTKVIVPVHYAGIACEMEKIMTLADKYNLVVVEDAAHAIDSFYCNNPLGGIGHFGCFSFHETKNIQCGEGGMLAINDEKYFRRSEIIWEKGTNRAEFFRGSVDKYGWMDIGSSFLPSEISAAFLKAQIENINSIQTRRIELWNLYYEQLKVLRKYIGLPLVPDSSTNNAHLFYILTQSAEERDDLIAYLNSNHINSTFHYQSLHLSPFFKGKYTGKQLKNSVFFSDHLVRLPLYYELSKEAVLYITNLIFQFYIKKS